MTQKDGCGPGQKKVKGKCVNVNQRIKLTEDQARKLYRKYQKSDKWPTPSMIGVANGYKIFPLNPKEALLIKTTKKGKYMDGIHIKNQLEKKSWREATTPPSWVRK